MRGNELVDAIERNRSHVDGHQAPARAFEQVVGEEHLAQCGIVRQHRNDRVAADGIRGVRGNVGAGAFEFMQRLR